MLEKEGHDVTVIDKDSTAFERLPEKFSGRKMVGLGFDRATLLDAGIEEADAFIAVARGDNHNAVSAYVARNVFGVPIVVARIYNPERARIYHAMGIVTISPVAWAANEIIDYVLYPGIHKIETFGNGEVRLVECECSGLLRGKSVQDIEDPGKIKVVSIVRKETAILPYSGQMLEEGDRIILAVDSVGIEKINELLRG
jgi:trk system potassium uptake protein TrkA